MYLTVICMYICIKQICNITTQMYCIMKQKTIPKKGYSFRIAYDNLSRADQRVLRKNIMKRLQIERCTFYHRMKGVEPTHIEYQIIKEEFQKLGIEVVFEYEREPN